MIHVDRLTAPVPEVLTGSNSRGVRERDRAIEFFSNPANYEGENKKKFTFSVYSDDAVKEALDQLFHHKCAYCESKYEATQPMDVEHYRPKGAVIINGEEHKPAYYWLAADWDNLLPSCTDCNRRRYHEFKGVGRKLAGKETLFPIADESNRARTPGEEAGEERLLLDPCRDQPEEHLEFLKDDEARGLVRPSLLPNDQESPKGKESIEVYGLQRRGLRSARRARLTLILEQIVTVGRVLRLVDHDPSDANVEWLSDELEKLRRFREVNQPYAGMARQFVNQYLAIIR